MIIFRSKTEILLLFGTWNKFLLILRKACIYTLIISWRKILKLSLNKFILNAIWLRWLSFVIDFVMKPRYLVFQKHYPIFIWCNEMANFPWCLCDEIIALFVQVNLSGLIGLRGRQRMKSLANSEQNRQIPAELCLLHTSDLNTLLRIQCIYINATIVPSSR